MSMLEVSRPRRRTIRGDVDNIRGFVAALPSFDDLPLAERRTSYDRAKELFHLPAEVMVETVAAGGVPSERISGPASARARTVLYLHGGAYVMGSPDSHRHLGAAIAQAAEATVLLPHYRLAPEHPFPAALEDAVTVYRWLISDEGGNVLPRNLVIAGDSAGGGLTMATLCKLRDEGIALPGAGVCFSPWVDLECAEPSWDRNQPWDYLPRFSTTPEFNCAKMYAGELPLTHPLVSPIHADIRGLPPLLIQVGEVETLHDEAVLLAKRAKDASVDVTLQIYPDMVHVFQGFGSLAPQVKQAMMNVGEFIDAHLCPIDEPAPDARIGIPELIPNKL